MGVEALRGVSWGSSKDWEVLVAVNSTDFHELGEQAIKDVFSSFAPVRVVNVGRTQNRAESILACEEALLSSGSGSVCVRDCDNAFELNLIANANVMYAGNMMEVSSVRPSALSFVQEDRGVMLGGCERGDVTQWFAAGAYSFKTKETLLQLLKTGAVFSMTEAMNRLCKEDTVYVSAIPMSSYKDWGTAESWRLFRQDFRTIFVDIDGVLMRSSHKFFPTRWSETSPIIENCVAIKKLVDSGKVTVVLTTARSEDHRAVTEEQLKDAGIRFHALVMGLPTTSRVLINDVKAGERATAEAINLQRDSPTLLQELQRLGIR